MVDGKRMKNLRKLENTQEQKNNSTRITNKKIFQI